MSNTSKFRSTVRVTSVNNNTASKTLFFNTSLDTEKYSLFVQAWHTGSTDGNLVACVRSVSSNNIHLSVRYVADGANINHMTLPFTLSILVVSNGQIKIQQVINVLGSTMTDVTDILNVTPIPL
jgi:hypothetical protein